MYTYIHTTFCILLLLHKKILNNTLQDWYDNKWKLWKSWKHVHHQHSPLLHPHFYMQQRLVSHNYLKRRPPAKILSPVDKKLSIQELETRLNILPVKNIQLDCIRFKNGKLVVKTSCPDSIVALKEKLKFLTNRVIIKDMKSRRSKIIIFDAPKILKREQIEAHPLLDKYKENFILIALQRYLGTSEVDYRIFWIMRTSNSYGSNVVLEMDYRHAFILQNYKVIKFGLNRRCVKQYFMVTGCTKCQSLDYTTRSRNPENRHFCEKGRNLDFKGSSRKT